MTTEDDGSDNVLEPAQQPVSSARVSAKGDAIGSKKTSVERELEEMRVRGTVKTRREEYKDYNTQLTTPEEAAAYLAQMRAEQSKKDTVAPPSHLAPAELDDWHAQQKKRAIEMKNRNKEAEALLRGYRANTETVKASAAKSSRRFPSSQPKDITVREVDAKSKEYETFRSGMMVISDDVEREDQNIKETESASHGDQEAESVGSGELNDCICESQLVGSEKREVSGDEAESERSEDSVRGTGCVISGNNEENLQETENDPDKAQATGSLGSGKSLDEVQETGSLSSGKSLINENSDSVDSTGDVENHEAGIDVRESAKEGELSGSQNRDDTAHDDVVEPKGMPIFEPEDEKKVEDDPAALTPTLGSSRYHLYASYACPWAHRTLIVRALKGLEEAVSVTIVHPTWRKTKPDDPNDEHRGWIFGNPDGDSFTNTNGLGGPFPPAYPGNAPDPFFNAYSIREIYENANDFGGKYTVPILWDKETNSIVSKESSDIIRMLNSELNEFAKNPDLDLYPEDEREKIDAVNDWVYPTINNGVYRCGFSTTQSAYDAAIDELTESLDKVSAILEKQRFIAGDKVTEADIRLFVTLLRFDEVYAIYFKTNTRSVMTNPVLLNYCREIYHMKGVAGTCNMEQIKAHYFCSHAELNKFSVIPRGPGFMKLLSQLH